MFHMLSCFNLQPQTSLDTFRQSLADFSAHLKIAELVHSVGPIGRRQRDTIMDTDSERDQEYYLIMSFHDRAQCDRAAEHIFQNEEPAESIHKSVWSLVSDPVFICWEDT